MRYLEQLATDNWKAKRKTILIRDNYKCQTCLSDKNLQVHHKCYIKGKLAWEYEDSNLITLCSICHSAISEKATIQVFDNQTRKQETKPSVIFYPKLNTKHILDYWVYIGLKQFMNWKTNKAKVSLDVISEALSLNIKTVISSLSRLKKLNVISFSTTKNITTNYEFNPLTKFEQIEKSFIKTAALIPKEKAYILAAKLHSTSRNLEFTCKHNPRKLAKLLGVSENTAITYTTELKEKEIITQHKKSEWVFKYLKPPTTQF